jgi:hypothetical protein
MSAPEQTKRRAPWARPTTVAYLVAMALLGALIPLRSAIAPTLEKPAASASEEPEEILPFFP